MIKEGQSAGGTQLPRKGVLPIIFLFAIGTERTL